MELNPTLLFSRITCVLNNSSEMGSFFAYELAPQPPSLFYGDAMRKPTKSSLGLLLKSFTKQTKLPENGLFVLDQCCPTFLIRRAAQDIIMKPRAAPVGLNSKATTKIC